MNRMSIMILWCCVPFSAMAQTMTEPTLDDLGGSVEAVVEGKKLIFPLLKSDISADVQGDIATVKVTQTFANPLTHAVHAKYLFPLNKDAAVYAMQMEVGDELISAKIQKIEEAKKTFEKAKKQGKAAALLEQHRPNMYTQSIANLMPHAPIKVTISYMQSVPKIDGLYELVVPLVVGPRYQPPQAGIAPAIMDGGERVANAKVRADQPYGQWELEKLPVYPLVNNIDLPKVIDDERVSIDVNLQAGMNIALVRSDTHSVAVNGDHRQKNIQLAEGRVVDNRDFVLRYQLAGVLTNAGMLTSTREGQGYFSLMIEPPAMPQADQIAAREMVFVLDTSGSMYGEPMEASKVFMQYAMQHLREKDYFRIIRFGNNAEEYSHQPVRATLANVQQGLEFVSALNAGGGTNIPAAIKQSFIAPPKDNVLRIVVFLTDGYIGNEMEVLKLVKENIGDARIYAFGVGSSVNRFLLDEMALAGRGFARYIDPTEDRDEVAVSLAQKLDSPVLTDIAINWGEMQVSEVTPKVIPDLFAGGSLRVQGKYAGSGKQQVKISGKVNGHQATLPLVVEVKNPQDEEQGQPIALLWARSQIADLMRLFSTPTYLRESGVNYDTIKQEVVSLGLQFALSTRWTSFVAVSEKIVNDNAAKTPNIGVPLPKVKGVSKHAYAGHSTPEPEFMLGLMVMLASLMGGVLFRKKHVR